LAGPWEKPAATANFAENMAEIFVRDNLPKVCHNITVIVYDNV